MRYTTSLIALVVIGSSCASAQQTLSQADLLRRVIDLDRLTTPPAGERTGMFTSYDRRSRIDENGRYVDWDANGDAGQFIRTEADGWCVMAEMDGPGVITRIWSANPYGQIRIILDGKPAIDAPFEDLFNQKLPPFTGPLCYVTPGGGNNCYFPIGYARSCKVVIRDSRSYYHINCVTFPAGTAVTTFSSALDDAAKAVADEIKETFLHGFSDKQLFGKHPAPPTADFAKLGKGEKLSIETFGGGGVIRALYVALTDRRMPEEVYALHHCILRVYVDGQTEPSVEAPLVDFFGTGFDLRYYNSLVLGTDKRTSMPGETPEEFPAQSVDTSPPLPGEAVNENRFMYCYFPMPFNDTARVEIENLPGDKNNKEKIGLMLMARVDRTRPPEGSLRFYARFRKEDPCKVFDYPILETTGRGRIVGCMLNVDCPRAGWWGEGDDKVWIDGEAFPSYFGTGSEDYLGDAWGLHLHVNPLQGGSRVGAYGKNSAYRWHIADCIDFEKSARFTIENYAADVHDTYYSTVAYWYGEPGAANFFKPLTLADVTPPGLRIPGAVEIEGHVVGEGWGNVAKQKYAGGVEFSHEEAANITTDQRVKIKIPSKEARTVRLTLRVHPRRAFETVEVADESGRIVGTAKYDRTSGGMHPLGVVRLRAGDNLFTVRCTPHAILDCWVLEEVPKSERGPEGEDLEVSSPGGAKIDIEYGTLNWSGGAQRVVDFKAVGDVVKFALPESKEDRACLVRLVITRGPTGGRFQALLDDQPLGEPIDTYADEAKIEHADVGSVQLKAGRHTLALRAEKPDAKAVATAPAAGPRLHLGLDTVELVKVFSPFAYECESLPILGSENTNHTEQGIGGASGDSHIWCRPTAPGAWIEFAVPVQKAGKYKLSIVYTTSFDYGIVQTYVSGKQAGEPFDTFGRLGPGPIRPLGVFDLPAGPLHVTCEVTGKSDKSPGYYFGVDCIIVEPVK
jgi:hypothetical protein